MQIPQLKGIGWKHLKDRGEQAFRSSCVINWLCGLGAQFPYF